MKKYIAYILLTCLLLSCFAGCKKNQVTSTDITQTDATLTQTEEQGEVVQNDAVMEEFTQQAETKEPQQTTKQQQPVSQAKPKEEQQATTTVVPQKQEQPSENGGVNNGYMADVLVEHPTFTTEAALQSWLKGNNTSYFANDRTQMMGTLSANNKVTYRRPAIAATTQTEYVLNTIETYPLGNAIYYIYSSTTNPNELLSVLPQNDGIYNPSQVFYERYKERVEQNKERYSSVIVDGITFYYTYDSTHDSFGIVWQQFGKAMFARCDNIPLDETTVHQKAQQLIPLIKIEQVTINLNSDHVTQ